MKYIIILLGIIILGIIVFSVIEEKTKYKDYEKEELNEKEKTLKALRFLIYVIIALLIPTVIYKILLWTEILKH